MSKTSPDAQRPLRLLPVIALLLASLACNANSGARLAEAETATSLARTLSAPLTGIPGTTAATNTSAATLPGATTTLQPTPTLFVPRTSTPRPATAAPTATHVPPTPVPPTHTPQPVNFTASFIKTTRCNTFNVAVYQITNSGTLPLESLVLQQEGPPGDRVGGDDTKNRPFKTSPDLTGGDCLGDDGSETLAPGITAYVYERAPNPPDSGTSGVTTITACTLNRLDGTCATKTLTFTWP